MRFGAWLPAVMGQCPSFALEGVGKETQRLSGFSVVAAAGQVTTSVKISSLFPEFVAPCPVHWSQGLGKPLPFVNTI